MSKTNEKQAWYITDTSCGGYTSEMVVLTGR
jgi:hypothetical protein